MFQAEARLASKDVGVITVPAQTNLRHIRSHLPTTALLTLGRMS